MNRYANIDCPICEKPLEGDMPVVVCPTCGAPYHMECYKQKGECVFHELHEKGEDWKAPQKDVIEEEQKYDGQAPLRCSRCGTVNPANGIFCQVCGNQLVGQLEQDENFDEQNPQMMPPFMGAMGQGMPLNPFVSPFGGVSPDEKIDDVPAKELAIFVGRNTQYFLPKFKLAAQTKDKAKTLNWASFFFMGGYFLYRKMYLQGVLLLLLNFVLAIPSTIITLSSMFATTSMDAPIANPQMWVIFNAISTIALFCLRFACGFFANTLYKQKVYKKIAQIKEVCKESTQDEYYHTLAIKGSVATKLIFALLMIYLVGGFVSVYMMLFMGVGL